MLTLSLDTSAIASAVVLDGDDVAASFATEDTRSHAEVLAPAIRNLLDIAKVDGGELDAVVVGIGPGPFTGLRAGIVTARTLAFVWKVPLYGVMSLDAIAFDAGADAARRGFPEFAVATDARRQEVYWARYALQSGTVLLLEGPSVGDPAEVPDVPVYGRGAGLYPDRLCGVEGFTDAQPMAESLGRVAADRLARGEPLEGTTPLYLRGSDAKVPGPRKRAL